jgi:O-succinylbenzoic acid--CoA ligase
MNKREQQKRFKNAYKSLIINGAKYDYSDLKKLLVSTPAIESFKKDAAYFFDFLSDWLDENDFVEVTTSGSTGTPKKLAIFKERMINSALMTGKYFNFKSQQTALLCLPTAYIAGKMMLVRAMVWGLDLRIVAPSGNPMEKIEIPIDFAAMVPLQVQNILDESPEKFNLIRTLIIGGGKVNAALYEQLQTIPTACYATYGMTETVTHVAIKKLNQNPTSDCFHALSNITFSKDNRGCLVIKAPQLADELVITNDLVDLKNEKTFEWLGRVDNVINTGGVKVFPEKIESKLETVIEERFFITALPDEKLENKVVLIIEGKPWSKEKTALILPKIKLALTKFESPKDHFFVEEFVETETKKIQRNRTKEKLIKYIL